jgi:hypothetical protein
MGDLYQLIPKSKGIDNWKGVRAIQMSDSEIDRLVLDRYGEELLDFVKKQLANGQVVQTAWGFLRQKPSEGDK